MEMAENRAEDEMQSAALALEDDRPETPRQRSDRWRRALAVHRKLEENKQGAPVGASHGYNLGEEEAAPWRCGVEAIDACLPDHGLSRCALHEIAPLKPSHMPSLTGFAFALLARMRSARSIIWCVTSRQVGDYGHLYAHGLQRYGIAPSQIIFARLDHPLHLHFALEEALKTPDIAAVIGEGALPDFTGSRRLSMLAREGGTPCLLMSGEDGAGRGSAALTRWQVMPVPGIEDPHDPLGPGMPTWRVALTRSRGGRAMPEMEEAESLHNSPYPWRIFWDEQTHSFHPAPLFADRSAGEDTARNQHRTAPMVGRDGPFVRSASG